MALDSDEERSVLAIFNGEVENVGSGRNAAESLDRGVIVRNAQPRTFGLLLDYL